MTCTKCGEKPKKGCGAFPKAVIEIDNPEQIVLIRKVMVPASMGDESTFPPTIGKYHNVLLEYEASGGVYLYSSDGIPTKLSSDVTELQAQLNALRVRIGEEEVARADADTALSNRITSLDDSLATVAKTGSYNDLTNKPTIGNATLTIKRNGTNVGTFTANATTNKSVDIVVPTKTSDLTNDGSDGTSTYVEADELPTVDRVYSASSNNAIANSTVTNSLNRDVMTNLALDTNPSTTTINLKNVKTNLANPSSSTTTSIPLPVASSTQAGVMNSATFDAVTNNTNNINAILNGAVAISNLPASPTQAQLTTAWENETGLTSLINRASVYDVTNNKVWTYYTNDQTWHAVSNTSQVTVNTFTNSSEGTIKGSTNDGQVFAENDGTGSVNGWDILTGNVASNTSKLATIEQGAEVNVQANWTQTDVTADDYIKNKPTIPTVNNATLTIQKNGTNVQTFTANSSTNKTANITVPTAVSELTNDANYATTTQLNNGLATKQDTLTAGNNIQINGNTISATDTTYTAGNAIDITNGEISADIHPADFFTAEDAVSDCGSDLSLDDTIASTLRSVEVKGDTFQQAYSGKNLVDFANASLTVVNNGSGVNNNGVYTVNANTTDKWGGASIIAQVEGNTTYTFSATVASTTAASGSILFIPRLSSATGQQIESNKAKSGERAVVTFTTPSGLTEADIRFLPFEANATAIYTDIMLEKSSTATAFEPYTGGIPAPNPDYPQNIQVVTGEQTVTVTGKNIFDKNNAQFLDGYFENNGTIITTSPGRNVVIYLPCEGSKTYAIKGQTITSLSSRSFTTTSQLPANGVSVNGFVSGLGDVTIATPSGAKYLCIRYQSATGTTASSIYQQIIDSLMVEEGLTSSAYEPYQSQSYEVNLGKNLLKIKDSTVTVNGITYTPNTDGSFSLSGTATANANIDVILPLSSSGFKAGEQYTLSTNNYSSGIEYFIFNCDADGTWRKTLASFSNSQPTSTVTLPDTVANYVSLSIRVPSGITINASGVKTMIEQGPTATSYAPYFTPIELCKIGDYQDYIYKSGDDWYVHKACGKYTFTGNETLGNASEGGSGYQGYYVGISYYSDILVQKDAPCLMEKFIQRAYAKPTSAVCFMINGSANIIWVVNDTVTMAMLKNILAGTDFYYPLATPTDTQITDATLVGQLEALAGAQAYNDQTNIIVTAAGDNLPATLCVEAYRKSLSGVIEAIDNACTCGGKATHLVLSNPTTATWNRTGTIGTVYPTSASVSIDTFASTDVVFTKDDGTTMTVGDLYTALTNGKSFEIDLPFGEINSTCSYGSDEAAVVATVENAKLDGSSKQTLDQTSQGRLSEMYTSSVPVAVSLSVPGGVLLDERFGVEHLMIDDGNTMTSSYRFVVNTYSYHEPFN